MNIVNLKTHFRKVFAVRQSRQLTKTILLENKEVQVMASSIQPSDRGMMNQRQTDNTIRESNIPKAVITYNKLMMG